MTKRGSEPTLCDSLLRETFGLMRHIDKENRFRATILQARKFVLDDDMSAFLADLAWAALTAAPHRRCELMEQMRTLARLPHEVTWIEFNAKARAARAREYGSLVRPDQVPSRIGWLMMQHPQIETAFRCLECVSESVSQSEPEGDLLPIPSPNWFCYAWRTDDGPLPWKPVADFQEFRWSGVDHSDRWTTPSAILTGISSYNIPQVDIVSGIVPYSEKMKKNAMSVSHINEYASDLRYVWALLATLSNLPVKYSEVRASKGFVARGSYRRFVDHKTLTLTIPARRSAKRVAMEAIAVARRKAHPVRGHWRKDWRAAGSDACAHEWQADDDQQHIVCKKCQGVRSWIKPHQRGDASLGIVTHDYVVTHPAEK